ncbi:O-antigen ligase family protein [Geomonas sp. RF6]|uniref:O-antigen ligase family protein n=1 Tax=Geomonas sp. RF6 TaxID=2897342 RepID=UPI001E4160E6|nr:O-antigen ligase family protein [Geomonas sp. RF6]UFS71084.1 O-antigen ligase family protein [Geomonas sp. RF6]
MTKELALVLCTALVVALLVREHKLRPLPSVELWIPLLWLLIIGTRPVSAWFEGPVDSEQIAASYIEGSPLDRNIFLVLLFGALYTLWKRRLDWKNILLSNRWLLFFFIYCGVSVLWSDFFFVSFKRWVKDLGNLLMILIILGEEDPFGAAKALFGRYICIAVPFSMLLVKYFPGLGRYYNRWTYEPSYCGVTTNKNELGIILVICGIFLVQDLMEVHDTPKEERERLSVAVPVALLLMSAWLLRIAGSATGQVCLLLGAVLLLSLRSPQLRGMTRHLGAFAAVAGCLLFLFYATPSLTESVVTLLGRDVTFTGRTEIWKDVLSERNNPWIGTGYRSFWLGPALERLHLNQAHNGYIETYLNGGFIGLILLVLVLLAAGRRFAEEVPYEGDFSALRLTFFIVAVLYNWTEAMFNGLSLIWFVLLLAVVVWPEPEPEFETSPESYLYWGEEDGREA